MRCLPWARPHGKLSYNQRVLKVILLGILEPTCFDLQEPLVHISSQIHHSCWLLGHDGNIDTMVVGKCHKISSFSSHRNLVAKYLSTYHLTCPGESWEGHAHCPLPVVFLLFVWQGKNLSDGWLYYYIPA